MLDSGTDLISVIVPVYNVEKYLEDCLQSLRNQTYENLDIILVDDGSTDNSGDICRNYCKQDSRFRMLRQENQGLSGARNSGLKIARGSYLCFVDSDDWLADDFLEVLYKNEIAFQADISMCAYYKVTEAEKNAVTLGTAKEGTRLLDRRQMIQFISTTGTRNYSEPCVVTWNKLFHRDVFEDLFFPNKFHEDEYMILDYIMRAKRIVWTDRPLCYYRQRENSIMSREEQGNLRHLDAVEAVRLRLGQLQGKEYEDVFGVVLRSYFENVTIYFHMLRDYNDERILKKRLFPKCLLMLMKYGVRLGGRGVARYVLFLLSQKRYYSRYWK